MTKKNGKCDVCTECGANLDPGEQCDCGEEYQQDKPVEQKKE